MPSRVLIVEDEPDISDLLAFHLRREGYDVSRSRSGIEALQQVRARIPDLVLLDLMLPGMDGLDVCRRLRQDPATAALPIVMLTAKGEEVDRVLGLEMGADDYLTKPFSVLELSERVKALFRRVDSLSKDHSAGKVLKSRDLHIDLEKRSVRLAGKPVDLTAKEFDLLAHFARHPGRVLSRTQLLDSVWGYSHSGYEHTVNSHINRLRTKIEKNPNEPEFIETVWGVGYKFREES